ncbi:MAG TPA: sugar phosphate isomerase/epimerase [Thermomicrobiales bacterium]|nr:sugar phosphate isomerase/epimerase [Thermomicrobiales bacterium]
MKLTIREAMVPGETFADQLAWLETMGIDGIELHAGSLELPREELHDAFAGSTVLASAIEGIPRLLDADPAVREDAFRRTRERLTLAGELGAVGVLVVPQFGRTAALHDLSPWKTGAELERELLLCQLGELAPTAREAGVHLFLEPLNRYEAYIVNRVEQGAEIAREAGGAPVATMADFFHMNIEEADIAASIHESANHIVYVHVADSNRLQPGQGHLDFQPGFAALKDIGYDGWLGIECRVSGDYDTSMRTTAAHIRKEWEEA